MAQGRDSSQPPCPKPLSLDLAECPERLAGWRELLTTLGCNLVLDLIAPEIPRRQSRAGSGEFPSTNYRAVVSQSGFPCQGIRQSIVSHSINLYNKRLILQAPCMKINPDPPLLFSHQQGCFPATTPPAQGCSDSAAPGKVRSSELGWRGQ